MNGPGWGCEGSAATLRRMMVASNLLTPSSTSSHHALPLRNPTTSGFSSSLSHAAGFPTM